MSLNLSATAQPANAATRRQRWLLLSASAVIHAAVLIPIAMNLVSLPQLNPEDRKFEVWIDLVRPERVIPPVHDRPVPPPKDIPVERTEDRPLEQPVEEVVPQPPVSERQVTTIRPMTRLDLINAALPDIMKDDPVELPSENITGPNAPSAMSDLAPSPTITMAPRPHIEAIDGPAPAANIQSLNTANRLPGVEATQPDTAASEDTGRSEAGSDTNELDVPVPRRPRLTAEEEAALARAVAAGRIEEAWVYDPSSGGPQGGAAGSAGQASGGASGTGAAAGAGNIYFRGTPVDCTQPHMLSDIQKLSCDSAEQRRIQSAIDRGVRVIGTGDAARDARNNRDGQQRMNEYEQRRLPPADSQRGNVGVQDSPANTFGIGASGRHLDRTMQPDSVAPLQTKRDGPEELKPQRTPH